MKVKKEVRLINKVKRLLRRCVIPKLFHKADLVSFMKLNKSKILETLKRLNNGATAYQTRKVASISVRRVYQIKQIYEETDEIPDIGKKAGQPVKMIEQWEIEVVKEAYGKYRVSADTLERVIDWHYYKGAWIFGVEDDASRKLLALLECKHETTDESIKGMMLALEHGKIKQCICDHGSQFISNLGGDSRFAAFLEKNGIKQILCRINHPQSNGKIEKWFGCYDRHREAFNSIEEFLHWYNDIKPHRSLKFDILETPSQAFIRKLRK